MNMNVIYTKNYVRLYPCRNTQEVEALAGAHWEPEALSEMLAPAGIAGCQSSRRSSLEARCSLPEMLVPCWTTHKMLKLRLELSRITMLSAGDAGSLPEIAGC
jgi:hypothetical protein